MFLKNIKIYLHQTRLQKIQNFSLKNVKHYTLHNLFRNLGFEHRFLV